MFIGHIGVGFAAKRVLRWAAGGAGVMDFRSGVLIWAVVGQVLRAPAVGGVGIAALVHMHCRADGCWHARLTIELPAAHG